MQGVTLGEGPLGHHMVGVLSSVAVAILMGGGGTEDAIMEGDGVGVGVIVVGVGVGVIVVGVGVIVEVVEVAIEVGLGCWVIIVEAWGGRHG